LAHARTPLALEITMLRGLACPFTIRIAGSTAAPSIAARLLKLFCMRSFFSFRDGQRNSAQGNSAITERRSAKDLHYVTRQVGGNTPLAVGQGIERSEARARACFISLQSGRPCLTEPCRWDSNKPNRGFLASWQDSVHSRGSGLVGIAIGYRGSVLLTTARSRASFT
jgi:hypothetical protein